MMTMFYDLNDNSNDDSNDMNDQHVDDYKNRRQILKRGTQPLKKRQI